MVKRLSFWFEVRAGHGRVREWSAVTVGEGATREQCLARCRAMAEFLAPTLLRSEGLDPGGHEVLVEEPPGLPRAGSWDRTMVVG